MGNCMETYAERQETEEMQQQEVEEGEASGLENGFGKSSMRVKIVLTKEELEWLMLQLNDKEGRKLEDVLEEIERGRGKIEGWKPSLESIMESPEVLEMDR